MTKSVMTLLVVAAIVLAANTAMAGLELDTKTVVVGNEITITATKNDAPLAHEPLEVTYYPNSEIKRIVEVGRTDEAGRINFVPEYAGITSLAVGDQSKTIAVRFDSMPVGALIVFLFAGTLLIGGIALGVKKLR